MMSDLNRCYLREFNPSPKEHHWANKLKREPEPERREPLTQIQTANQLVTQITVIEADPEQQNEALSLMADRARFMSWQPGFVSISLHRSLDGRRLVNYIQWQSRELLQSAHQSPDFRKAWGKFDDLTDQIDPHLYEVVQVLDAE
jgi:quinol monooxygenase YgiN